MELLGITGSWEPLGTWEPVDAQESAPWHPWKPQNLSIQQDHGAEREGAPRGLPGSPKSPREDLHNPIETFDKPYPPTLCVERFERSRYTLRSEMLCVLEAEKVWGEIFSSWLTQRKGNRERTT